VGLITGVGAADVDGDRKLETGTTEATSLLGGCPIVSLQLVWRVPLEPCGFVTGSCDTASADVGEATFFLGLLVTLAWPFAWLFALGLPSGDAE